MKHINIFLLTIIGYSCLWTEAHDHAFDHLPDQFCNANVFENRLSECIRDKVTKLQKRLGQIECDYGYVERVMFGISALPREMVAPQIYWNVGLYEEFLRNITYNVAATLSKNGILDKLVKKSESFSRSRNCKLNGTELKSAFYDFYIGLIKFLYPYRCHEYIARRLLHQFQHHQTGNYCYKLQYQNSNGNVINNADNRCPDLKNTLLLTTNYANYLFNELEELKKYKIGKM
ncbi:hypothetical protein TrispH2_004985 [Trichoplax sp. H2]|nr:hypothetical protein TrispH2_004985 [Trichoplax sp. H2]|eukprot:RDD43538.1 hypothetical protein TrispH2_004985 [Trichoplax sp. H2]